MNIVIRKIEEKDYPAVATIFVNEILGNKASLDDYSDHVALFFDKTKGDENYHTFVALSNDHVVGFISAVTMIWVASGWMFIQCFAVKKDYQNQGIGTRLLRHTEDYARAKGINGIGLQSGTQRTAAHAFYEHQGYIKSNYFYRNF